MQKDVGNYKAGNYTFHLGVEQVRLLSKKSRRSNTSMFVMLLAAMKTLLYRYTGQLNSAVGIPVSGREFGNLNHQIGFYVNVLPIVTNLDEEDNLSAIINKVKNSVYAALEHQVYPFDYIVKDLGLAGKAGVNPLFNIMITYDDDVEKINSLPDVQIESRQIGEQLTEFALDIKFTKEDENISCSFNYNAGLFKPETLTRIAKHFRKVVKSIIDDDKISLIDLEIESQSKRENKEKGSFSEDEILFNF
ncbi:amino acid adenylation domain protein [Fulvivirga imtechensis AK7]|uniref:Amino acid adenylation domain protein n=1 Tax=Fulvivirga imtechensis AK7 TaxID=1237149 RepID=L8JI17_9BACT|nr:amino acid adenylation domain protein [Fulvivirga imtechensis AK7]